MRSEAAVRRSLLAAVGVLGALAGLGACSSPKSFVVVSMRSAEVDPGLDHVVRPRADVMINMG